MTAPKCTVIDLSHGVRYRYAIDLMPIGRKCLKTDFSHTIWDNDIFNVVVTEVYHMYFFQHAVFYFKFQLKYALRYILWYVLL